MLAMLLLLAPRPVAEVALMRTLSSSPEELTLHHHPFAHITNTTWLLLPVALTPCMCQCKPQRGQTANAHWIARPFLVILELIRDI